MTAVEWVTCKGWTTAHAVGPGLSYSEGVSVCGTPTRRDRVVPPPDGMRRCGRCLRSVGDLKETAAGLHSPAGIEGKPLIGLCCPVAADMMRQRDDAHAANQALRELAALRGREADDLGRRLAAAHMAAHVKTQSSDRILHAYDALTLALEEKWGGQKKKRFIAKVEARHPWPGSDQSEAPS